MFSELLTMPPRMYTWISELSSSLSTSTELVNTVIFFLFRRALAICCTVRPTDRKTVSPSFIIEAADFPMAALSAMPEGVREA